MKKMMNRRCALLVAGLTMLTPGATDGQVPARELDAGDWIGVARLPVATMPITLRIGPGQEPSVRVILPSDGADLPGSVTLSGDTVRMKIRSGGLSFRGVLQGDSLDGTLDLRGRSARAVFARPGSGARERIVGEIRAMKARYLPGKLEKVDGSDDAGDLDAQALSDLVQRAQEAHSHSLVLMHRGRLIGAWYADGEDRMIEAMSVTKSIVNLAVGRLITTGQLDSLDEPVASFFPEWDEGPKKTITLRHLMSHTSGLEPGTPTTEIYASPDVVQFALDAELLHEPGQHFAYNNNAANLVAAIVERVSGSPLPEFLRQEIFGPMGVTDFVWAADASGNPHGMAGLGIHASDLARIGQLVLQKGEWDGQQLIDPSWFSESLRPASELNRESGLLWWLRYDGKEIVGYRAAGYLGQYLTILPDHDLVGVRMVQGSPAYAPETDGLQQFDELLSRVVEVRRPH